MIPTVIRIFVGKLRIFLLAGFILLMGSCSKNEQGDTVVQIPLGIAVSLTGSFGPYGLIQKNGLEMAIEQLNSGSEITGIKFVPYISDDKSSPDTCSKIFRDMVFDKKVMVIIGPTSSNCAFAADTIAQNNRIPVIGISNTVQGITEMGNFIFRNSLPESAVIPNTVLIAQSKLGFSKVAIIYGDDDSYTIGAYNAFRAALENTAGVQIVRTETVNKGDTLFTDLLTRVKDSDPDVIVIAALVNEASRLMVQGRKLDIPESVRFIGGNSFNTSQLWMQAGQAAQGAICGTAWSVSGNTPGKEQFVTEYFRRYNSKPDQFAAQAYASITIILDAVYRCREINSLTLRDALANTRDLQTILGTFSFDANRDPVHVPVVQELVDGSFRLYQ